MLGEGGSESQAACTSSCTVPAREGGGRLSLSCGMCGLLASCGKHGKVGFLLKIFKTLRNYSNSYVFTGPGLSCVVLDQLVNSPVPGLCRLPKGTPPRAAEAPVSTWFMGGSTWLV